MLSGVNHVDGRLAVDEFVRVQLKILGVDFFSWMLQARHLITMLCMQVVKYKKMRSCIQFASVLTVPYSLSRVHSHEQCAASTSPTSPPVIHTIRGGGSSMLLKRNIKKEEGSG